MVMKKIFYVIACLMIVSCRENPDVVHTLASADKLMETQMPDSAYQLLRTIDGSTLRKSETQALYALLYTQCLHKTYREKEIHSDSLISIAVEYYENRDMKRYGRSLNYLGIVMQELCDVDRAMYAFKKAEEAAMKAHDTLYIALINSNIGSIYCNTFMCKQGHERLRRAKYYFDLLGDTGRSLLVTQTIGRTSRSLPTQDSAQYYLSMALDMATQIDDTTEITITRGLLATSYQLSSDGEKAKQLLFQTVNEFPSYPVTSELYHAISRIYLDENRVDSAEHYLHLAMSSKDRDSLSDFISLYELAEYKGDYKEAYYYSKAAQNIADSILKARNKPIFEIEKRYDQQKLQAELEYEVKIYWLLIAICSLSIVILLIISAIIILRKNRRNREKTIFIEQLKSEAEQSKNILMDKLDRKNVVEMQLKDGLEKRFQTVRQLIDISYRYGSNSDVFVSKFKAQMNMNQLERGVLSDLIAVVNAKYYGIVDYLRAHHPNLKDDDMTLLCLICCKFSALEMTVFYNYTNDKTIYSSRSRLARKMGLEVSIEAYLDNIIATLKDAAD